MTDVKLILAFLCWHNHTLEFCQCNYAVQPQYVSMGFSLVSTLLALLASLYRHGLRMLLLVITVADDNDFHLYVPKDIESTFEDHRLLFDLVRNVRNVSSSCLTKESKK